jgi:hypothetical protein
MKVKIKFSAIKYSTGKTINFTKTMLCPDFEVIDNSVFLIKHIGQEDIKKYGINTNISIESQIMDWLDKQDKMQLIYEHDLLCILSYEVAKKKIKTLVVVTIEDKIQENELKIASLIDEYFEKDELRIAFNYSYQQVKNEIYKLTIHEQIKIVLSMVDVGLLGSITAYKNMLNIFNSYNTNKKELL